MNNFKLSRLSKLFKTVLVPISIIYIVMFIYVAVSRIEYPFELNWIEGGFLDVVERVLDGMPIYTEPTLEYVPFIYTPLYYILAAAAAGVTGPGFLALRLVSFVSSLLCLVIIYFYVSRETKNRYSGFISAGLFAAFYNVSDSWLDIGRNDPLFLLILLSALYIVRFYRNNKSYLLAGILLFLAFFAKQSSLIVIIFLLGYAVIFNRKIILPVIVGALVLLVGSTFFMDRLYDGWYSYFVFELPFNHDITLSYIALFWTEELLRICMVPIGFIIYNLYLNFQSVRKTPGWRFNLFAAAGMIFMAWFLRIHSGGGANALLPALAIITIIFGISVNHLLIRSRQKLGINNNKITELAYFLIILQFIIPVYNPFTLIPSSMDRAAGNNIVENIRKINGNVFIPSHGYLAVKAGKKRYAHAMAIYDVLRSNDDETAEKLGEDIRQAFKNSEYTAAIYDYINSPFRSYDVDTNYVFEKYMVPNDNDFFPVTGTKIRPQYLFGLKHPRVDDFPVFEMIGPMPLDTEE
ncbi:MAG: glycosyltransferase family 39 protein [Candidatus Zixiibacteriota bacterium]|nr:MAG: glycosyltransferase family 39 protein [candidate division Zixibacteria bacterium]